MRSAADDYLEIPDILREVPPEKFRQIVETLMGVPYRTGHLSWESQFDEEVRRPTGNGKVDLLFSTDWQPWGDLQERRDSGSHELYMLYVGTANDTKVLRDGKRVPTRELWKAALARATPAPTFRRTTTLRAAAVAGTIVLRRVIVRIGEAVVDYWREGD